MKYFTNCTTLEALKHEYRRLCMIHHPDRGGDTRTALKAAGYRWHSKKKCWYAQNTEQNLQALRAIETALTV